MSITSLRIKELMTKKPHLIHEGAPILEAAKRMRAYGCGILPVGTVHQIVGIVTDRDIITRAIAKGQSIQGTLVTQIMTKGVVFCYEQDSLQVAIHQMNQHHLRRVLVKNKDQELVGILSLGDIIRRVEDKELLANLLEKTEVI